MEAAGRQRAKIPQMRKQHLNRWPANRPAGDIRTDNPGGRGTLAAFRRYRSNQHL